MTGCQEIPPIWCYATLSVTLQRHLTHQKPCQSTLVPASSLCTQLGEAGWPSGSASGAGVCPLRLIIALWPAGVNSHAANHEAVCEPSTASAANTPHLLQAQSQLPPVMLELPASWRRPTYVCGEGRIRGCHHESLLGDQAAYCQDGINSPTYPSSSRPLAKACSSSSFMASLSSCWAASSAS